MRQGANIQHPTPAGPALDEDTWSEPIETIRGRNWTKATVTRRTQGGQDWAFKDYRHGSGWLRRLIGRWLIARERRAFARLREASGIPQLHGMHDPLCLVTEWIPGSRLADHAPASSAEAERIARSLAGRVREMHRHGVAHGDLHGRDVLIDRNGDVFLLDFATAMVAPPAFAPLKRRLFERWRQQDLVAVARLTARLRGQPPDTGLAALPAELQIRYARSRRLKRFWDRLRK